MKKIIQILLLISLMSSIFGVSAVKRPPTSYQAEEDDNVTIGWDSHIQTDMSFINLLCFLQSEPLKLLYEMINGVESPESQHQQFAGRVTCDKDALRKGRVRLHVPGVTTYDAGSYRCDMSANYDKVMRRWALMTTEHFVLNVTSHGETSDVFDTTPKSPEGTKDTPGASKKEDTSYDIKKKYEVSAGVLLLIGAIVVVIAAVQRCFALLCRRDGNGRHVFVLLRKIETRMEYIL